MLDKAKVMLYLADKSIEGNAMTMTFETINLGDRQLASVIPVVIAALAGCSVACNKVGAIMAQFRGTLKGNRGGASRLGTKKSGLSMTANGWDVGIRVELYHDVGTNKDEAIVSLTRGSHGGIIREIGRFVEGETT